MEGYKLTQDAKRDLVSIWAFGAKQFGSEQVDTFLNDLLDHFEEMARRPLSFPAAHELGANYRRSVFQRHAIYFRQFDNFIDITAIIRSQDIRTRL